MILPTAREVIVDVYNLNQHLPWCSGPCIKHHSTPWNLASLRNAFPLALWRLSSSSDTDLDRDEGFVEEDHAKRSVDQTKNSQLFHVSHSLSEVLVYVRLL